jgi:hypothetical protein
MPEVKSTSSLIQKLPGSECKQAEQTVSSNYKSIRYHTFKAVDYNRYMAWKARSSQTGVGMKELTSQKTDADKEDVLLPTGQRVLMIDTEFKLERKPS